jgi:hypothetical protein
LPGRAIIVRAALGPAVFDRQVLSLDITSFAQSLMAGRRDDGSARPERAAEGDAGDRFPRQRLARPVCAVCGRVPTAACAPVVSGIIDRRSTANNTSADDRAALVPHRIEGSAEISSDDPISKICARWLRRGVHFYLPGGGEGPIFPERREFEGPAAGRSPTTRRLSPEAHRIEAGEQADSGTAQWGRTNHLFQFNNARLALR